MNKFLPLILLTILCGCENRSKTRTFVDGEPLTCTDITRIEQRNPDVMQRYNSHKRLRLEDIKALSQAGISDDKIIGMIQESHSHFNLTSQEVFELKNAGVSSYLTDYMINYT
ncbi:MAG: hypothetical protein SNF33_03500 [Candidatus Algichlamydia australiensis]|nr:hypothetical protein [Chlamydiales bacterium]